MPRVLIAGFCTAPGPDRIGVQLSHIIRALARQHAVDVLVVRRGDQAYVERFANSRLLRVPVPEGPIQPRIDAFRRALCRQLESADYDIVHFRDGWAGVPVLEMRDRLKYAAVFDAGRSPLGEPPLHDTETATALERDELECIQEADLVLAASEPARRYIASLVPEERVRLVPPGVDVDLFDWETAPASGAPRILYAGALNPGRGVRVLLRAMVDIAAASDAHLALAGRSSPEFFASIESAIAELGLGDRVELLGEVAHEEVPALIATAAVCVAPGAADLGPRPLALYPTKLLEYMACQRPVLAPHRSTVTMLMRDQQHGLLFQPEDAADLAEKTLQLLDDPGLRFRLARGGYELVRRAHTASATRRELVRAYAWLAGVSPWRERFAALLDDLPTRDMPVLAAVDPTGPGGWARAPSAEGDGRSIAAFDGDPLVDEVTDSGQVETGSGGLGDVTRVEQSPLLDDEDSGPSLYRALPTLSDTSGEAVLDDWVVEDSRIRDPSDLAMSPVLEGERGPWREPDPARDPVDSRFVAGELEVPPRAPTAADPLDGDDPERAFTALSPPLGPSGDGDCDRDGHEVFVADERTDSAALSPGDDAADGSDTAGAPALPAGGPARPSALAVPRGSPSPSPSPSPPPAPAPAGIVVGAKPHIRVGSGEDTGA